jgi:hypothetical protein
LEKRERKYRLDKVLDVLKQKYNAKVDSVDGEHTVHRGNRKATVSNDRFVTRRTLRWLSHRLGFQVMKFLKVYREEFKHWRDDSDNSDDHDDHDDHDE